MITWRRGGAKRGGEGEIKKENKRISNNREIGSRGNGEKGMIIVA